MKKLMDFDAQLEAFTKGYEAALFWSSTGEADGETVNLDEYPASTQASDHSRSACRAFLAANYSDVCAAAQEYPFSPEHNGFELAGHDFALTRNGHGAGFWDGDLPEELGSRLTVAAKAAGECWPYIGDDGSVYIS